MQAAQDRERCRRRLHKLAIPSVDAVFTATLDRRDEDRSHALPRECILKRSDAFIPFSVFVLNRTSLGQSSQIAEVLLDAYHDGLNRAGGLAILHYPRAWDQI